MIKKSLKQFNPQQVAVLEALSWKAYYDHKFLKLIVLLIKFISSQFQLPFLRAIKVAYFLGVAAFLFRKNFQNEDMNLITRKLEKAFKVISEHAQEKFDYKEAAQLEARWWYIDRYTSNPTERRKALQEAVAVLFSVNANILVEYADYRAQAMELVDIAQLEKKYIDWSQVSILLEKAFVSLHKSVM